MSPRRLLTPGAVGAAAVALAVGGCAAGPLTASGPASPSSTPTRSVVMAVPPAADTPMADPTVSAERGGLGGGDAVYLDSSPDAVVLVRWTERDGQL